MTTTSVAQNQDNNPHHLTAIHNTFLSRFAGNAARIGGVFYDCLPRSIQFTCFDSIKNSLWVSLLAVPVIEVMASVSIPYIALSVLAILSLQFIVISTLRRGSGDDLNIRYGRAFFTAENLDEADFLLMAGARDGFTTLMGAARSGDVGRVRGLLANNQDPIDAQDYCGKTALTWAAEGGHTEIVRVLAQAGANLNHVSLSGTPLMLAAESGHTATVQALLSYDPPAAINYQSHTGWTALMRAVVNGHRQTVAALTAVASLDPNMINGNGHRALDLLPRGADRLPILRFLLEHPRINPDLPDHNGHTGLVRFMIGCCEVEEFQLLLQRSDLSLLATPDSQGLTALDHAMGRQLRFFELLVQRGARLPVSQREGSSTSLSIRDRLREINHVIGNVPESHITDLERVYQPVLDEA